jgi:GH15 family glucan-1,4-alpha-glucosidase
MSSLAINEYALISDCHSAGLVSKSGSIDWLCFPRFDSPSVFGRLLDDAAGHWSLTPAGDHTATRRYHEKSMVLETTFGTAAGEAVLVDAMAVGRNEQGHELGKASPGLVIRELTCTRGNVEFDLDFSPRIEYGLVEPLLSQVEGGLATRGGASILFLSTPIDLEIDGGTACARFRLEEGGRIAFSVEHRMAWEPRLRAWNQQKLTARLDDTEHAWRTWADLHQGYEGPWRELVHHSGRVLQAMTFEPTGAIVAAATTSLPEAVGGERNWDYRYTWVRDASLTLEALWIAACPDEAHRFFEWMTGSVALSLNAEADLQIMFGIGGEHDLSERTLPHLSGWRGSRPVRVGNGAWSQRQLDVYGELLCAARRLKEQLPHLEPEARKFLIQVADTAAGRWREKDQGIWEVRGEPRDFLYSKLMCWCALECAIELAPLLGAEERVEQWTQTRAEIRDAILDKGWSNSAQAFTQAFGSDDLDASNLVMPIVGFIAADDPRMKSTIDAIAARLTDGRGLVYRYLSHDGLEGEEGTFLLCTFWLAQAQAMAGEVDAARETFERAIKYRNDVDLLAEEVEPTSGELLGNFPQAFSHIGLVNAAWAIAQAEKRSGAVAAGAARKDAGAG